MPKVIDSTPKADGFRNYYTRRAHLSEEKALVDRAQLLTLTAPEMTVLIGQEHSFADFWWVILVAALLVGLFIWLAQRYPEKLKLGKMRWPMTLYLTSISLHGIMGLALMVLLPGTNWALMGLGSFLFMLSDFILTFDRFVMPDNKCIVRSNSASYFIGLLLIVLSMAK